MSAPFGICADARRAWLQAATALGGRLDGERQRSETGALRRFRHQYQVALIRLDPACRQSVVREGVRLCQRGCDALVAPDT
jgi:hypothetical protein